MILLLLQINVQLAAMEVSIFVVEFFKEKY